MDNLPPGLTHNDAYFFEVAGFESWLEENQDHLMAEFQAIAGEVCDQKDMERFRSWAFEMYGKELKDEEDAANEDAADRGR